MVDPFLGRKEIFDWEKTVYQKSVSKNCHKKWVGPTARFLFSFFN